MSDVLLKYLTELSSATSVADDDLLHINQGGNDRSIAFSVMKRFIVDAMYPANSGVVVFFAKSFNPNNEYPGTLWSRVPGYGRTIRLSSEDMGDVLSQGGSDNITLNANNIPSHYHHIDLYTDTFDYGTKATTTDGLHSHDFQYSPKGWNGSSSVKDGVDPSGFSASKPVTQNGQHSHSMYIGGHSHRVTGDTWGQSTTGASVGIANQYVKLIAWYRTA